LQKPDRLVQKTSSHLSSRCFQLCQKTLIAGPAWKKLPQNQRESGWWNLREWTKRHGSPRVIDTSRLPVSK